MITDPGAIAAAQAIRWWQAAPNSHTRAAISVWAMHAIGAGAWRLALAAAAPEASDG